MISENKRNGSGYYDPTAYMAMMNVRKEGENKMEVYRGDIFYVKSNRKDTVKSQSSPTVTVECVGDVNKDEALKVLPYHIYYPDPAASQSEDVSGKAVVDGPEENEE